MFVILEGPDGAGKSTFIRELALELWRAERGTTLINPKRSPCQPVMVEYKERLDFYKPGSGIDLILDRCWYSDDVYGPIWRDQGLEPGVSRALERWAYAKGAIVVFLDQPDEVLEERLRERGDPDVKPEEVAQYANLYRRHRWDWELDVLVNPSLAATIEKAKIAEEQHTRRSRALLHK